MFKKLKRIYYRKRDRGKGKQFLFTVCLIGLVVLATIGYGSMVAMEYLSMPAPTETKGTNKKSPKPEQSSEPEETEVSEDTDEEEEIDLSGMETFLAFMKDEDYDRLLEEVKKICDTVTVLRDGEFVCERPVSELTTKDMANLMVGRELSRIFPPKLELPEEKVPALELNKVTLAKLVHDASLKLYHGEILGLAGLGGSGRTELAEAVYGIRRIISGKVLVHGREKRIKSPAQAVAAGIAYLTEDRQSSGVILSFPLAHNCTLISLRKYCLASFIGRKKEKEAAEKYIRRFEIKTTSGATPIRELSGGNQQKGAIAKSLDHEPEIFIFDEPTRGIDIKSRSDIYYFINGLARQGMAFLIISSDLEEIIGLCRRVAVMREGTVAGVLENEHVNEKEIMYLATGVK